MAYLQNTNIVVTLFTTILGYQYMLVDDEGWGGRSVLTLLNPAPVTETAERDGAPRDVWLRDPIEVGSPFRYTTRACHDLATTSDVSQPWFATHEVIDVVVRHVVEPAGSRAMQRAERLAGRNAWDNEPEPVEF